MLASHGHGAVSWLSAGPAYTLTRSSAHILTRHGHADSQRSASPSGGRGPDTATHSHRVTPTRTPPVSRTPLLSRSRHTTTARRAAVTASAVPQSGIRESVCRLPPAPQTHSVWRALAIRRSKATRACRGSAYRPPSRADGLERCARAPEYRHDDGDEDAAIGEGGATLLGDE